MGINIVYAQDSRNGRTDRGNNDHWIYTSAGIDMIDVENQRANTKNNPLYTQDRVSGYTINQLERAMVNATSWNEWKENIKSKYPNNPTKNIFG